MPTHDRPPRPGLPLDAAPDSGTPPAPAPATPPDPTDGSIPGTPARLFLEQQAGQLDAMAWVSSLYASLTGFFGAGVNMYAYKLLVDQFLAEVGPAGPVERMLAEQLLLSHLLVGRVSAKGAAAENADAAKVYLAAGARLMAEFRQTALALKAYKTPAPVPVPVPAATTPAPPPTPKPVPVGVVTDPAPAGPPRPARSELGSNRLAGYFRDEPVAHA